MSLFNAILQSLLVVSPMTNDQFKPIIIVVCVVALVALILLFVTRKKK